MSPDSTSPHRNRLREIMDDLGVVKLVTSHTRVVARGDTLSGSIIDLVYTNRIHSVVNVDTISNPVDSDHLAVNIRLRSPRPAPLPSVLRSFLQIHKGDFEHLRHLLHLIPWGSLLNEMDVEDCSEVFLDIFHAAVNDSIPKTRKRKSRCSPWITSELRNLLIKKRSLFILAKRTRDPLDWVMYKSVRNDVKNQCRKAYWSYVNKLFASDDNKRKFWAFIRSRKHSPPPPKFTHNDQTITQPDNVAAVFSKYFCSVFTPALPLPDSAPTCTLPIPDLSHLSVSVLDVYTALIRLQKNKSPGPDGILPIVLRHVALEIAQPLCILFNTSLRCGKVPSSWKCANITPVHKSGDRSSIANYRPVDLTSVLSKLLEGFVAKALQDHVDTYGLLNKNQHGFTTGRSCVTQLVNVFHQWASTLDRNRAPRIDAVFLDMSKAFDKMPHVNLLSKLAADFNVQGTFWRWLRSFLSGRIQRILFMGSTSEWEAVSSGVPQGSVLGPKLFNMFVNDIFRSVLSTSVMFADDMLIYREINSPADEGQLQTDLDALQLWSCTNGMSFNTSKTKVMHVTRKRHFRPPLYHLGESQLDSVPTFKYLGVVISSNLTWNSQVDAIVSRANRLLGFIRLVARGASTNSIFCLYKTLVLPILEYGIPAWHPTTSSQINKIERVQRTVTRLALKQARGEMTYDQRLEVLHWSSLASRREYLMCAFAFKCLYGICDCETLRDNIHINPRRLDTLSFRHLPSRTQALFFTPSRRLPRLWDKLPHSVKDAAVISSLSSFLLSLKAAVLDME